MLRMIYSVEILLVYTIYIHGNTGNIHIRGIFVCGIYRCWLYQVFMNLENSTI